MLPHRRRWRVGSIWTWVQPIIREICQTAYFESALLDFWKLLSGQIAGQAFYESERSFQKDTKPHINYEIIVSIWHPAVHYITFAQYKFQGIDSASSNSFKREAFYKGWQNQKVNFGHFALK